MTESLIFVAGLPRAGSTLLMNLLGQNPAHHVTPTSGLIELFVQVKNRWPEFIEFKAEGLGVVKPRILSALRGLLTGYFENELLHGQTVFDKSRGWLQYIEPLEEVFEHPVKVIVPVRDVREIVASFEKLYRTRGIEYREAIGEGFYQAQTIEGRAKMLLGPQSVLGLSLSRLRDALARGVGDRLIIVPYSALTDQPRQAMELLHAALALPHFSYDPNHVNQITHEDDYVHGIDLHRIRHRVEARTHGDWETVLPSDLCRQLSRDYHDIESLCEWDVANSTFNAG